MIERIEKFIEELKKLIDSRNKLADYVKVCQKNVDLYTNLVCQYQNKSTKILNSKNITVQKCSELIADVQNALDKTEKDKEMALKRLNKLEEMLNKQNDDIEKLYNEFNIVINLKAIGHWSLYEQYKYFDKLAQLISEIPLIDPVEVKLNGHSYQINKKYQEIFEMCYREVKLIYPKVKKEIAEINQKKAFEKAKIINESREQKETYLEELLNQMAFEKKESRVKKDESAHYIKPVMKEKTEEELYLENILNQMSSEKKESRVKKVEPVHYSKPVMKEKTEEELYLENILNQMSSSKEKDSEIFDSNLYNSLKSNQEKIAYLRESLLKIRSFKVVVPSEEIYNGKTVIIDKSCVASLNLIKAAMEELRSQIKVKKVTNPYLERKKEDYLPNKKAIEYIYGFNNENVAKKEEAKQVEVVEKKKEEKIAFVDTVKNKIKIKKLKKPAKKNFKKYFNAAMIALFAGTILGSAKHEEYVNSLTKALNVIESDEILNVSKVEIPKNKQNKSELFASVIENNNIELSSSPNGRSNELEEYNRSNTNEQIKVQPDFSDKITIEEYEQQKAEEAASLNYTVAINGVDYGFNCDASLQSHIYQLSQKYDVPFEILMTIIDQETRGNWDSNGVVSRTNDYGLAQINICNANSVAAVFGWSMEDIKNDPYKSTEYEAYLVRSIMNKRGYTKDNFDYADIFGSYNGWLNWRQKQLSRDYVSGCMARLEQHFGIGSRSL